jgi:hypothetical protein
MMKLKEYGTIQQTDIHDIPHTDADYLALTQAGIRPSNIQPRERSVPCHVLGCNATTASLAAHCLDHYQAPYQARSHRVHA